MKLRQIIIILCFIIPLGGIFYMLARNDKRGEIEEKKESKKTQYFEVVEVENKPYNLSIKSYGEILLGSELILSPEINGVLRKGKINLKPGTQFKKGDLLFKIENNEILYSLNARKSNFINLVSSIMPNISLDFNSEKSKWENYLFSIRLDKKTPPLPKWTTNKERLFLASKNILSEYFNLKGLEEKVNKQYVFAPFNGTIVNNYTDINAVVGMGSQIIKIAKTGNLEMKVPIASQDINLIEKNQILTLYNSKQEKVGEGKIIRISNVINRKTRSFDAYLSVKPKNNKKLYGGLFLNVKLYQNKKTNAFSLPKKAVKNKNVFVFTRKDTFIKKPIEIIHYFSDSILVKGLKNKEFVMTSTPDFYKEHLPVEMILKTNNNKN